METLQFKYVDESRRYAAYQDGREVGRILLSLNGEKTMVFRHVQVEEQFRGQGIAGQMLAFAMEDVKQKGLKVVPVCPYARKAFDNNEEYRAFEAPAKRFGIFVGSFREGSYSRRLADLLEDMTPEGYVAEIIRIKDLPFYDQAWDTDGPVPDKIIAFRAKVKSLDGVIFVTPEYNRTFTAPIKNAVDIASRPMGKNNWSRKPAMVMGITPGALGALAAALELKKLLTVVNTVLMGQPEVYIAEAKDLFNEDGSFINEGTREFIQSVMNAFIRFYEKHK